LAQARLALVMRMPWATCWRSRKLTKLTKFWSDGF
jgi:hypothetical protein